MTMTMDIKDQYIDKLESFLKTLPEDAVVIKKSLDEEIQNRVSDYKTGKLQTSPFKQNLSSLREKLVSQI